jgi:hypothetical protein
MEYSPFEKSIEDLDEFELQKLVAKEVTEGWYIEYKVDLPSATKVAKSIASFANTRGGYYIIGVKTDQNKASEITGINSNTKVNLEDQLSRMISSNISPCPFFKVKTVILGSNSKVIVVMVEEGLTPPYITSQGIIYQRENNESIPVRDRHILERFSEKTESYQKRIDKFCRFDYSVSKAQSERRESFLEVFLFPIPFNIARFAEEFHTSSFFKRVADSFFDGTSFKFTLDGYEKSINLTLNFNAIQASTTHILIRPIHEHNIIDKGIAAELHANGAFKFTFPMREFSVRNPPSYYQDSNALNHILDIHCPIQTVKKTGGQFGLRGSMNDLYEYEEEERKNNDFRMFTHVIDGVEVYLYILMFLSFYKTIIGDKNPLFAGNFGLRARATNLWRKFLFFDDESYLESVKKFNIPININDDVEIPSFIRGKYFTVDINENFLIPEEILEGIGLPDPATLNFANALKKRLERF